ncbi:hypothetical protein SGQ44_01380 [Flavobacterium sp. Fl-77]|uniref:Uncharacterized protein n=1 Tax=Flavobacterium flavipigmentatum TaxID=2893884 RepID=A0AAJ2SAU6_9FLAO|nr:MULTISPECIES: hypothetical protein [unclassified Flavobacterium]MDX6180787.1 hypothetical protein [Flavobacterium sp. Fl-33]MDX6184387.1 hypothetical protein [Flavobacterium sp. Fl-77]UFH39496.1 hypothetical protein LNP22_04275 [Flavobacterium sp. F-70]
MKKLILFALIISLKVFATEQISDILIYNGKTYEWNNYNPARDYLETFNFKVPDDAIETTANYGYYIFTYTIENDSLFLTDIKILVKKEKHLESRSVFEVFFKDKKKIIMDLYSKIQTIPYGKKIEVRKSNWTDIHYPNYLVLEFNNGKVEKHYDLNYKSFLKLKKKQFLKFKQTPEYPKSKLNEIKNLENFNEFRPKKSSIESYLEFKILGLIKTLKE